MIVAAAQMRFAPSIDANLAAVRRLAAQARQENVDALLFPECATTGYSFDFSTLKRAELHRALEACAQIAAEFRLNLLVGTPLFRGRKLYNALAVFDRRGRVTHCYAKCHLTEFDRRHFTPGDAIALFEIDGVPATAIICHERRYPELVRLAVMAGARILFHPNAGLDSPALSRAKRCGRDGIAVRAFENAIFYVFANSVGKQSAGKWSAGDSKIVAPSGQILALADNRRPGLICARLQLSQATGSYAQRGMCHPPFLTAAWQRMVASVRARAKRDALNFDLPQRSPERLRPGRTRSAQ